MGDLFTIPESMVPTLLACLILTGIHVYLGIHVVARKVIFVDLALAQIAALGTVVGVWVGYEAGRDAPALYLYSLALTAAGALVFSITKMRFERVPHEAIIGIVYAVAFALTLLLLARLPVGPQEIDRILKGDILYLNYSAVLQTALIYAAVGVFHFLMRKSFLELSFNPEVAAQARGRHMFIDFLFYLSFGFVVTSSVAIAGVFLVFSYLVIPAVGAMLFSERLGVRLAIGWIGGALISAIGVKLSYHSNLPTSPLIVCLFAAALVIAAAARALHRAEDRRRTVLRLAAGAGGLGLLVGGLLVFSKPREDAFEHALHMIESPESAQRIAGLARLAAEPQRSAEWVPRARALLRDSDREVRRAAVPAVSRFPPVAPELLALLQDPEPSVRQEVIRALRGERNPAIAEGLLRAAGAEADPDLKIEMLDTALEAGSAGAIDALLDICADESEIEIFRRDALKHVQAHVEFDVGQAVHGATEEWWKVHGDEIRELIQRVDDPAATPDARRQAHQELRGYFAGGFGLEEAKLMKKWWQANHSRMIWDAEAGKFRPK